ncbi:hypothetical protein ABZV61_41830, partial [Streptomyces sp900116325]
DGRGGRPEGYCHRQILDAIRYVVDNGVKWANGPEPALRLVGKNGPGSRLPSRCMALSRTEEPERSSRGPVEFARQPRGGQPLQRAAGALTLQIRCRRRQSPPVPVPEQLVDPPVDHRVHTLFHVLAQHRIAPPRCGLSRADLPALAACRDQSRTPNGCSSASSAAAQACDSVFP